LSVDIDTTCILFDLYRTFNQIWNKNVLASTIAKSVTVRLERLYYETCYNNFYKAF